MKNRIPAQNLLHIQKEHNINYDIAASEQDIVERKQMNMSVMDNSPITMDEEDQTVWMKISDTTVDRQGEVMLPSGCDHTNYDKNPVILCNHDYSMLPVGRMMEIIIKEDMVMGKIKFAPTEDGQTIYELVKGGFLSANSVGFLVKEAVDKKTRSWANIWDKIKAMIIGVEGDVSRIITKWELLESSIVTLPANPNALALSMQQIKSKGLKISDSLKKAMKLDELSETKENKEDRVAETIELEVDEVSETVIGVTVAESEESKESVIEAKPEVTTEIKPEPEQAKEPERFMRIIYAPKTEKELESIRTSKKNEYVKRCKGIII